MNLLRKFISTHSKPASDVSSGPLCTPSVTGFPTIPASEKLEEENWPWYTPKSFYPVRIGDILHGRYQVLYKVGFGTTSTTWICRDLHQVKYVCMKSLVCDYISVRRELKAYEALAHASDSCKFPGSIFVRQALDQFNLRHGDNDYNFLIHEPLGPNVQSLLDHSKGRFSPVYVKSLAKKMLQALEFIHAADVIHADIQASNILLGLENETVLSDMEKAELKRPSSRKITDQTVIFKTIDSTGPLKRWASDRCKPVLCDFGEARTGQSSYTEFIQPAPYRAPELFLLLRWRKSVDIWNLGCMLWHFTCGQHLFSRKGASDKKSGDIRQLAWMVALLGPPPAELIDISGERALEFFNKDGSFKTDVPQESLESLLKASTGSAKKIMSNAESTAFLAFLRRMLKWSQKERATAAELLDDPWLKEL
ncbi:hypothetical protein D9619_004395 [Psilocybe cf. subviscida]|uniref:non-specific serine/threonine protein kinase n=1 Tax=Psilocybe cf. subviscida TaxID=2480587 RepID=A0A8H5F826_9AGAR|nr:hypothetical protein D9619_004395 [Psilocybe cf. subviscida]